MTTTPRPDSPAQDPKTPQGDGPAEQQGSPSTPPARETTRLPRVPEQGLPDRETREPPVPPTRPQWAQRPAQAPGSPSASVVAPGWASPVGAPVPSAAGGAGAPHNPFAAQNPAAAHGPAGAPSGASPVNPAPASGGSAQGAPDWWSGGTGGPGAPGAPTPSAPFPPNGARTAVKTRKGPSWLALFLAMLLTSALTLVGAWGLFGQNRATPRASTAAQSGRASTVEPVSATGDSPDWAAVAKAVSPATVTIGVSSDSSSGVGSGVIYDAQGDIVTNYHVISKAIGGAGQITVTLADGRIYEGEIVGHDQTTDLAVVRLKNPPADLAIATFGSSAGLRVGDEVMAIGAPLGLSNTVTTGIISALNRPVEVSSEDSPSEQSDPNDPFGQLPGLRNRQSSSDPVITNAIQVDASINPGNSGGPLFDSSGRVIGINSSIASNSGSSSTAGSIGLGFAIPVDLVTSVVDQIIATGSAEHAVLGVSVTTAQARTQDSVLAGAEIAEVSRGGAAEAAGLVKGDVIVAVNGESVSSSKQLTGYIRRYKGGDSVQVTYVRDGATYDVTATLQAQQG